MRETPLVENSLRSDESRRTPLTIEDLNSARMRQFDDQTSRTPEVAFGYKAPTTQRREAEIAIDDLYTNPDFTSLELNTALRLLAEANRHAEDGLTALRKGKALSADESILSIQSLLPELFACRGLGDGYGALINSVQLALINQHGQPLTEAQYLALKEIIAATRHSPFIRFDKARRLIRDFERHGFEVEPVSLRFLDRFFDEP